VTAPLVEFAAVSKAYGGLRPLRIQELSLAPAECLALVGLDQPMAEVFVNLVTGASLPDSGEVRVFGQSTAAIVDGTEWLAVADRFGIVSARAVLLDGVTVLQNLAIPFTLEIEPLSEAVAERAAALAREVDLPERVWHERAATLDAAARTRLRVARALALDPPVLLLEHATAAIDQKDLSSLGRRIRSVADRRGAAVLAITGDQAFAAALAGRSLTLDAATGRLADRSSRWFRRRLG
jgi:ABC-type branched-subunit amino acid transport system ATPase component